MRRQVNGNNIGLVLLIYLGWELLCVAYIACTSSLYLVSLLFVPALYSTLKSEIFPFMCKNIRSHILSLTLMCSAMNIPYSKDQVLLHAVITCQPPPNVRCMKPPSVNHTHPVSRNNLWHSLCMMLLGKK